MNRFHVAARAGLVATALLAGSLSLPSGAAPPAPPRVRIQVFDVPGAVALNELAALTEEVIGATSRQLKVVAVSDEAKTGDWEKMRALLSVVKESTPAAEAIWFAKPDGTYWTIEKGLVDQTLSTREYFPDLMAGKSVDGFLVISRSTAKRSVVVAEPVRDGSGRTIGALGASLSVESLSQALDQVMGLPTGMVFYALDAKGQSSIHRDPKLMFEYPSDIGGESLRNAVKEMMARPQGVVRYEFRGVRKTVLYKRSPRLHWVFALGRNT